MLWLHLSGMRLSPQDRCLHIAPDRGLVSLLSQRLAPGNYTTADLFPDLYRKIDPDCVRIDLCDLEAWPDRSYDYIIHSHVLEHTPCNLAYTLYHLHRMLRDGGRHIFVIPFLGGNFDEYLGEMKEADRVTRFGQNDHVRRFGKADIDRHIGAILNLPAEFDAEARFGAQVLRDANIPQALWRGYSGTSVQVVAKGDYKLGQF
jgi:phosphoglycolate phosphatase